MGDIKVEVGKRIRSARLNKGFTQIDICDDESELTIRQLARIENGKAMVTLPKMLFLSRKLGIPQDKRMKKISFSEINFINEINDLRYNSSGGRSSPPYSSSCSLHLFYANPIL